MWVLAALGLAHAGCDNAAVQESLAAARSAYAAQDESSFAAALSSAEQALACLNEPLRRGTAADWHRGRALAAAVQGGPGARERVVGELRAAFELDPTVAIFPGALPESYWTARNDEARALALQAPEPLGAGSGARLTADGAGGTRQVGLPAVLQCSTDLGAVLWTQPVQPGEPAPTCDAPAHQASAPAPAGRCEDRLSRGGTLAVSGLGLLLVGGSATTYALNRQAWLAYEGARETGPAELLTEQRQRANTTGALSLGAGALAGAAVGVVALRGCF